MELVEYKDEEYMRSFKLLNDADVNETVMKLLSSSSKYLSAYCRRKTIAIDIQNPSDANQESNSPHKETFTSTMDLNARSPGETKESMDKTSMDTVSSTEEQQLLCQKKISGRISFTYKQKLILHFMILVLVVGGIVGLCIYFTKTGPSVIPSTLSSTTTKTPDTATTMSSLPISLAPADTTSFNAIVVVAATLLYLVVFFAITYLIAKRSRNLNARFSDETKESMDQKSVDTVSSTEGEQLLFQKIAGRISFSYREKLMLHCLLLVLVIGGTIGFCIYFTKTGPLTFNSSMVSSTVPSTVSSITKKIPTMILSDTTTSMASIPLTTLVPADTTSSVMQRHSFVSTGPLTSSKVSSATTKIPAMVSSDTATMMPSINVMVVVAATVVVLAFVFAITCMVINRRRNGAQCVSSCILNFKLRMPTEEQLQEAWKKSLIDQ